MVDAYIYFLSQQEKKEFLQKKKNKEILLQIKKKIEKNVDVNSIFSPEALRKDKEMREWISEVLKN
jgi:hypothetical protein